MKKYKGKYMIGVYSLLHEGETLLALCDNITEFANYMNISKNNATVILHKLYNGITKYIKMDGRLRSVEFIKDEEEENE